MFPAGSVNHAIGGPAGPRAIPRSSCSKPSYRLSETPRDSSSSTAPSMSPTWKLRIVYVSGTKSGFT